MSSFQKSCTTCKQQIELSDKSGKWSPYNLDGTPHRCFGSTNGHVTQKQEGPLSIEDRLKRLESIVLGARK